MKHKLLLMGLVGVIKLEVCEFELQITTFFVQSAFQFA